MKSSKSTSGTEVRFPSGPRRASITTAVSNNNNKMLRSTSNGNQPPSCWIDYLTLDSWLTATPSPHAFYYIWLGITRCLAGTMRSWMSQPLFSALFESCYEIFLLDRIRRQSPPTYGGALSVNCMPPSWTEGVKCNNSHLLKLLSGHSSLLLLSPPSVSDSFSPWLCQPLTNSRVITPFLQVYL